MKKTMIFLISALGLILGACSTEESSIVCGRDWNPGAQVVADTTSEFELRDPLLIQFRYGKNFDFDKLKISFYEGSLAAKGKNIWTREVNVTEKQGSYTIHGRSARGGLMTAREITHQRKPCTVVVEFSTGDRVLASKELTLVKNK